MVSSQFTGYSNLFNLASNQASKQAATIPVSTAAAASTAPARCLPTQITVSDVMEADGTRDNKSKVVVPYNQAIQIKDKSKITLQATAYNPATNSNKTVTIPILSVSVDPTNNKNLIINTGEMVPKGAKLTIANGALTTPANTAIPGQTSIIQNSNLAASDFSLTRRGFKPSNINLFTKDAFPNATTAPNAPVTSYTETTMKNDLQAFLQKKKNAGKITSSQMTDAMNKFSAASTKAIVPDPKVRAALFSLVGTSESGAIDAILTSSNQSGKPFKNVDFNSAVTGSYASSTGNPDGTRSLKLSPSIKGESFQAIGSIIAHEALHQDNVNGQNEEVLADTARTTAWAENLLIDPSLANKNTLLVRDNNTLLLAMLNSGNNGYPKVGITSTPQMQTGATAVKSKVFVGGSESYLSLDNYIRTGASLGGIQDVDTVGNSYLNDFVSKMNRTNSSGNGFNRTTRDSLDKGQQAISNQDALKLASVLKLNIQ